MNERQVNYIKRQIRVLIGSTEKIDNLHHVSQEQIDRAFDTKRLYDLNIIMNESQDDKIYFAFEDRKTGYYYMTAII